MRTLTFISVMIVALGAMVGCSDPASPEQKTPPPSKEQLGTGQQFGYPSQTK